MESPPKPKRRPRYKGTHPRRFEEKYKELDPERYRADAEKVIARGGTPAGTHRPICVNEIIEILKPRAGEIAIDATLGYGGHTQELLRRILPGGKLIAFDQDPMERPKTESRLRAAGFNEDVLIIAPLNFEHAKEFLAQHKISRVDMVLADLGLSSMQMDDPARGFSFKVDAPFDLRMNPKTGKPASEILSGLSAAEIEMLLVENSDEPHARQIAVALAKKKPATTSDVAKTVGDVTKSFSAKIREKEGDTPIRRVFQAFRIAVNDEFAVLDRFLEDLPGLLKPGARVAFLSFHSGEDRRVKKSFQAGERNEIYAEIAPDIIRPSFEEQRSNPRSKSAKLRWAIRSRKPL